MNAETDINKPMLEKEEAASPLSVAHSGSVREKHLEGFSEEQKKMIRTIADIFVKNILKLSTK